MAVVRKTKTHQQIEELAKKVPPPLSWFIPDPNDPTSYVHPTAIGAVVPKEALRSLVHIFRLNPRLRTPQNIHDVLTTARILYRIPREELDTLNKLEFLKKAGFSGEYFPSIAKIRVVIQKPQSRYNKPFPEVTLHELGHHWFWRRVLEKLQRDYDFLKQHIPKYRREVYADLLGYKMGREANIPVRPYITIQERGNLYTIPTTVSHLEKASVNIYDDVIRYIDDLLKQF